MSSFLHKVLKISWAYMRSIMSRKCAWSGGSSPIFWVSKIERGKLPASELFASLTCSCRVRSLMLVFSKERGEDSARRRTSLWRPDALMSPMFRSVRRDQTASHQVDNFNSRWSTVIKRICKGKYQGRIERFRARFVKQARVIYLVPVVSPRAYRVRVKAVRPRVE